MCTMTNPKPLLRSLLIVAILLSSFTMVFILVDVARANQFSLDNRILKEDIGYNQIHSLKFSKTNAISSSINILSADDFGMDLEFLTGKIQVEENQAKFGQCQVISLEGYETSGKPGWPQIPTRGVMIGIPADSVPALNVLPSAPVLLPGRYELCPEKTPIINFQNDGEVSIEGIQSSKNIQGYTKRKSPIEPSVELVSTGFIRSQKVVQFLIKPFYYDPITGELWYFPRIQVKMDFNTNGEASEDIQLIEDFAFETILQLSLIHI